MAIDFLIFGLLLISFTINLLALGAFWVTPGLRTTANRFTINLLIINLIGCLILAPTLFLSGDSSFSTYNSPLSATTSDDSIEYYSKPGNHQMTIRHNGQLVEQEGIILQRNVTNDDNDNDNDSTAKHAKDAPRTIETIFKCNSTYYQQLTIDESSDTIVITEIEEQQQLPLVPTTHQLLQPTKHYVPPAAMRCWSIDMAAALGALAVLLVVGDTWCAVTDPLRYHSRISGVKAWVFIALTWALGIFFGALSAFRELDFESESVISKQKRFATVHGEAATAPLQHASESNLVAWYSSSSIFSMIFACIYFVVIILLPFGFVCGMYWRIFSEARENGVRMRQNGSSPLLQSALNLNAQQQQQQQQQQQTQQQQHQQTQTQSGAYTNSLCVHRSSLSSASSHGGGLHMSIDHQRKSSPACLRRDSAAKVLLPTISDDGCSDDADADSTHGQLMPVAELPDRNQNILLTLQTASGEIKRNYSARQLPLLGTSSQDFHETQRLQGIRQVHSSPNLQKYAELSQDSLSEEGGMSELLGEHAKRPHSHPPLRGHHHHHVHHMHHHHPHHHSHVLQIPAIHASPKALSYMSSLRHRLSNASSLFKYREESRAARISILVVIMFLVSYLPYGFLVLLQSRLSAANFAHSTQLAIFMLLLGNLSSPFIFAYRNKRVRRGVKRLFGLDARTRERHLQRQNSASGRGSGFLHRHSGNKSSMSIKRTGSKVSTYSANSCKYLTPQSSVASNGGPAVTTGTLRPNSSCSTIVNLHMGNGGISNNNNNNNNSTHEAAQLSHNNNNNNAYLIASILDEKSNAVGLTRSVRPILQRGITIVEQIPLPNTKLAERRNIFKMFCHSSKSLSCGTHSCAQRVGDNEPTMV